jgi:hypothetical protein
MRQNFKMACSCSRRYKLVSYGAAQISAHDAAGRRTGTEAASSPRTFAPPPPGLSSFRHYSIFIHHRPLRCTMALARRSSVFKAPALSLALHLAGSLVRKWRFENRRSNQSYVEAHYFDLLWR